MFTVRRPFSSSAVMRGRVHGVRQDEGPGEAAVAPFDTLEPQRLRVVRRALAPQRQLPVLDLNLDVLAGETRHLGGHDVAVGNLEQIDRRHPARLVAAGQAIDPLVERQEVLERIPPRKGHKSS